MSKNNSALQDPKSVSIPAATRGQAPQFSSGISSAMVLSFVATNVTVVPPVAAGFDVGAAVSKVDGVVVGNGVGIVVGLPVGDLVGELLGLPVGEPVDSTGPVVG